MKITYYGHLAFEVETLNVKILFDPYITANELAKEVNLQNIKPDFILLSHAHSDHIGDTLEIAQNSGATVIAIYEIANWLTQKGLQKVIPINIGGKLQLPFGQLRMTPALHSSSLPDGTYGGNPAGYVIQNNEKTFYFAGDTGLSYEMKLLGKLYNLDFAILPIGGHFTMDAEDAAIAAQFAEVKHIFAAHYDTFPPIKTDKEKARLTFQEKGLTLQLLNIGQTIKL